VQKRSLSLLILSILLIPAIAVSQETDEGLELPEVYIYGTHLGKIQLSPKKDFFPYLSKGNLYPHSRPLSPELRFPLYRETPHKVAPIQQYWLLLDAGAGNWWSDKVFLDCGLRNQQGLLSFRFSDFRRKNWAQDHSIADDYVRLKGTYGRDNYYVSGNVFYEYEKVIKGVASPADTVISNEGGAEFLTRLNFHPLEVSVLGDAVLFSRTPIFLSGPGDPVKVNENDYGISARATFLQDYFDILGNFALENSNADVEGNDFASTVSAFRLSLRKVFSNVSIMPGVTVIADRDRVVFSPSPTVKVTLPSYPICAFAHYGEEYTTNSYRNISSRFPIVYVSISDYQVMETKKLFAGIEGQWRWVRFYAVYKRCDHKQYPVLPLMPVSSGILFSDIKKDAVELSLDFRLEDFEIYASGEGGFHESVPHEPTTVLKVGGKYEGFRPFILLAGMDGLFDIQTTATEKVDIFSLNSGIEYVFARNVVFQLEANNIFDQRYEVWPGYTEGGIQFYASLKYKILQ
jgi:hypothetical protein